MFNFFKSEKPQVVACSFGRECEHATRPRGAHCNFQGVFLQPYHPQCLAIDTHGLKDFLLSNPHGNNLTKTSTVFPEAWSPMECTEKVMQALSFENKKIIRMNRFGFLKIVAYTEENIEIIIFLNVEKSSIALFYPNFQEEIA